MNLDLILKVEINMLRQNVKYVYKLNKLEKLLSLLKEKLNLLELIHSDIFYLNNIITCRGKIYFITFIVIILNIVLIISLTLKMNYMKNSKYIKF